MKGGTHRDGREWDGTERSHGYQRLLFLKASAQDFTNRSISAAQKPRGICSLHDSVSVVEAGDKPPAKRPASNDMLTCYREADKICGQ